MEKKQKPKVMIYCAAPWPFRTTVIGHLYEIAQVFPTVLLIGEDAQKLDLETELALKNKKLFPFLEEIISVQELIKKKTEFFKKNKYFRQLARNIIIHHKPDIVIVTNDVYPFDMYLLRYAKKIGAVTVNIYSGLHSANFKDIAWIVDRTNAYFRFPFLKPFFLKLIFAKIRKYLGYLLYNFILPILVGEKPFGGSSIVLYSSAGHRVDYIIGSSKNEYNFFIEEGLPEEKIYILKHPLCRESTRKFFEQAYFFNSRRKYKTDTKTLTLLFPAGKIGFRRSDYSIISEEEIQKNIIKIITLITKALKGWRVFIKPHPNIPIDKELEKTLKSISNQIKITNPSDPIDKYIEISDVIVASAESSTATFIAHLHNPKKTILTVDFLGQFLGDFFKDFMGIEYIDNKEKLIKTLELIKKDRYKIKPYKKIDKFEKKEFRDAVEMVNLLVKNSL